MQGGGEEFLQFAQFQGLCLAVDAGIYAVTVLLSGGADDVHDLFGVVVRVCVTDCAKQNKRLCAYLHIRLDQLLQEGYVPAHVIQRHHRSAVPHQCIVRIVPFRP